MVHPDLTCSPAHLSANARNALVAVQSCHVSREVWQQLDLLSRGDFQLQELEAEGLLNVRQAMETQARKLIAGRIDRLSEEQVIQLMSGLVRAMGFATKLISGGLAMEVSLDGLGLHPPHIKAHVHHR